MNFRSFLGGNKTIACGIRLYYTTMDSSSYYFEIRRKPEVGPKCVGLFWSQLSGGGTTSDLGDTIVANPNNITVAELRSLVSGSGIYLPKNPLDDWSIVDWTIVQ